MRTDTTICINSKVNGKQPSLEHRIYSIEGIAQALTTGFHYLIGYYEERALGADATENNLTGGQIYDNSVLDCYNCAVHRDIHTALTSEPSIVISITSQKYGKTQNQGSNEQRIC